MIWATFFVLRQNGRVYGIDPLGSVIQFGPLRAVDFAAFSVVVYWATRRVQWANVNAVAFRWLAFSLGGIHCQSSRGRSLSA